MTELNTRQQTNNNQQIDKKELIIMKNCKKASVKATYSSLVKMALSSDGAYWVAEKINDVSFETYQRAKNIYNALHGYMQIVEKSCLELSKEERKAFKEDISDFIPFELRFRDKYNSEDDLTKFSIKFGAVHKDYSTFHKTKLASFGGNYWFYDEIINILDKLKENDVNTIAHLKFKCDTLMYLSKIFNELLSVDKESPKYLKCTKDLFNEMFDEYGGIDYLSDTFNYTSELVQRILNELKPNIEKSQAYVYLSTLDKVAYTIKANELHNVDNIKVNNVNVDKEYLAYRLTEESKLLDEDTYHFIIEHISKEFYYKLLNNKPLDTGFYGIEDEIPF